MNRRFVIRFAAAFVVLGLGAANLRAGEVSLPTFLSELVASGNPYAVVGDLVFSDFQYIPTNSSPGTPQPPNPAADAIVVSPFSLGAYTGITLTGGFYVPPGAVYDFAFSYTVTSLTGVITDAYLALTGGNFGGDGKVSVAETFVDLAGNFLGSIEATFGAPVASIHFANGVQSIRVTKDMLIVGGTEGATVSIINQGYTAIPEPTSVAMMGLGVVGLFASRRFRRKAAIA